MLEPPVDFESRIDEDDSVVVVAPLFESRFDEVSVVFKSRFDEDSVVFDFESWFDEVAVVLLFVIVDDSCFGELSVVFDFESWVADDSVEASSSVKVSQDLSPSVVPDVVSVEDFTELDAAVVLISFSFLIQFIQKN